MGFTLERLDHVVVNCRDVAASAAWYERALGMAREVFRDDGGPGGAPRERVALRFGQQKLNLRPTGAERWSTGAVDAPGSLDLCFVTRAAPEAVLQHWRECGVAAERGPVAQHGALGAMRSVYCRDPDGNLVEVATYPGAA